MLLVILRQSDTLIKVNLLIILLGEPSGSAAGRKEGVKIGCKDPYHVFILGERLNGEGKLVKDTKLCSLEVVELYKIKIGDSSRFYYFTESSRDIDGSFFNFLINQYGADNVFKYSEYFEVGCGRCYFCRMQTSREWASRCMMELEYHKSSYFLTLTYDDIYVPRNNNHMTLVKSDFQKFMKRLRKHFPNCNIRFMACGEYGSSTFRPHYHAIVFGLELDDLVLHSKSPSGNLLYNSKKLDRVWSRKNEETGDYEPLGFVVVGDVTWESCAYVARYIVKKASEDISNEMYYDLGIEPEFTLKSNRPGLGYQYLVDHYDDIYKYDKITLSTENGGVQFSPPRYFDLKAGDFGIDIDKIKEQRVISAANVLDLKLSQTDVSHRQLLENEFNAFESKSKVLSNFRNVL